ncbi:MAG: dihydrodipicolinate synthase family protein [Gammaproteobacteria bacterium]|nr:dihydrodipicolinate synthase family protein [Gammaproteobacteria bacterium]MCY4358659.1 dihydrodipicolinate synthase family protein [Gammaproteobacteria bacterium]
MQLEGIYVPIITPFRNDLAMDMEAYGEVIDWQVSNGVNGIIIGGSTGEFFSLSTAERQEQLTFAVERIAGRIPVIFGVNGIPAERCYEMAEFASIAGADALLVAAPPYILPSQDELAKHVLEIDRIANLPIILYNYPARTGVAMEEEFLQRIGSSKNIVAIKESSGDAARIQLLAHGYRQFQLSAGAEDQVLEFYAWGARSWVSVIANFLPAEALAIHETCVLRGDFATGRKMMQALLPLMLCLEKGGKFLQCVKFACEIIGRPGGPVRPPLQPMGSELQQQVLQMVKNAKTTLSDIDKR